MSDLTLNGIPVVDTFAEAFPMRAARLVITARSMRWADLAWLPRSWVVEYPAKLMQCPSVSRVPF